MHEKRNNFEGIATLLVIGLVVYFFFFNGKKDIYRPVYYPNKFNLTEYIKGPDFDSLEEAREWIYELNRLQGDQNWDYEIGKNPKLSKYGDIEVCEETLK